MHPFDNGTVTFSASDTGTGAIDFSVDINAAFSGALAQVDFGLGGKQMESSIWNNLIGNVQSGCQD